MFLQEGLALRSVFQRRLATQDYAGYEDLLEDFLKQTTAADENAKGPAIDAAGFGVAGVVVDGRLYSANLPSVLAVSALTRKLNLKNIRLLNDLTATALSLERLSVNDLVPLNPGTAVHNATRAVIAAGTGLGEAVLFWDGEKYQVVQSEGGQADFAPRTEREIQLLSYLRVQLPYVSCEEIVSGRGFRRIHEFLNPSVRHESFESPEGNAASEITQRGLAKSCTVCVETLGFWAEIFGAVTGNSALQTLALGGIYLAGGIAVKHLAQASGWYLLQVLLWREQTCAGAGAHTNIGRRELERADLGGCVSGAEQCIPVGAVAALTPVHREAKYRGPSLRSG